MVYCPECISFGIDCSVDMEDYEKPCDRFIRVRTCKACGYIINANEDTEYHGVCPCCGSSPGE